ncbi:MAG TPA: S49 family peptidase [Microvirga sp.]|jgi:signal peptide peptidase SppA|nr:S49 family peptidase [Microvirga sp.]
MASPFFRTLLARLRTLLPRRFRQRRPRVVVVRLSGAIGAVMPLRTGLSLASAAPMLERAFAMPRIRAVAIVVNSPGGSPVQSHLIYKRIRALAAEKKVRVLVFVEDVAASGGYMIACAGDEIVADPSSIVGSIGVISAGFGFDRLIERLGIERRVHTIGENKAMLDPFRPEDPKDIERLKGIQAQVQRMFVDLVRASRGDRLKEADAPDLFTGAVWVGEEAVRVGLVDRIGDLRSTLRKRYGRKVDIRVVPPNRPSFLARWLARPGFAPEALLDPTEVIGAVEERAMWGRWGL